jgi:hypothetical protein
MSAYLSLAINRRLSCGRPGCDLLAHDLRGIGLATSKRVAVDNLDKLITRFRCLRFWVAWIPLTIKFRRPSRLQRQAGMFITALIVVVLEG